jgi:phosphoglycolate phosphatase
MPIRSGTGLANVLFDLDGTLTDSKKGITRCIRFALERLGATPPAADGLRWCIGPPLKGSFARLLNTQDDALIERALFYYRKRFAESGMFENVMYPQVVPALRRIKAAGIRVFLATSKPIVFARQILDHFRLTPFFDAVYGSELDGRRTDKGDLVAHILACEGIAPEVTLIAGDRSHDIIGGKRNGIMTAAVTYGYGTPEELALSQPDFIFGTISCLAAFIVMKPTPKTVKDSGAIRKGRVDPNFPNTAPAPDGHCDSG